MNTKLIATVSALVLLLSSCTLPKKEITVVIREPGSGTREAFDRAVGNGTHFLEEYDESGKKIDRNSIYAIVQTKSGSIVSSVASDKNAIGYLSQSALSPAVKAIRVNGVSPSAESVLDGTYPLRRPFVICTNGKVAPTPLCADFLRYLKSDRMQSHAAESDCILSNEISSAELHFEPQESLPPGEKILLRGSTSLEKLITTAARGYAACYGIDGSLIFDLQLEGSSVGIKAATEDRTGRIIGLSSATVPNGPDQFTVAYDALAVIVHPENPIENLSLTQLFGIFSGTVKYFDELKEGSS